MEIVSLLLRWSHILFAIVLVGGLIYQRFVLLPAEESLSTSKQEDLGQALRSRWSKWVMLSTAILLLSGLTNFFLTLGIFKEPYAEMPSLYHMLFGIKFLLALGVFALAALLSGRREKSAKFREKPKPWLNLSLVLALGIIICSGILRSTHSMPPLPEEGTTDKETGSLVVPAPLVRG